MPFTLLNSLEDFLYSETSNITMVIYRDYEIHISSEKIPMFNKYTFNNSKVSINLGFNGYNIIVIYKETR